MTATYHRHILNFKRPSGTSRGVMTTKETWFIVIKTADRWGIGECGLLRGLSIDDRPDYESKLAWLCEHIKEDVQILLSELKEFPSIQFGLETALKSFHSDNPFVLFPSEFTKGTAEMEINGLIWMGEKAFMKEQIVEKLETGFRCIKMKIGAIDFETETNLLKYIRQQFSAEEIELRVDANGAFHPSEAMEKLKILSDFELHSIEQPIQQGQIEEMAQLCALTPLPIALDEELIGVWDLEKKQELIRAINPQFIILKPSLVGGFSGTDQWISLADENNVGWWITSALESNIGLNAISQYTFTKNSNLPQGLGTGGLFLNNVESPLEVAHGSLRYNNFIKWNLNSLDVTN